MIKLIECPRDAMQGIATFIPTELKAEYINLLLRVGFNTIDFGSFVSPKAIPQLSDTREVLSMLDLTGTKTKLLAITANLRGVQEACEFEHIKYIGFPFSISETFQKRNTNSTIAESLETVNRILELCNKHNKEAVIYLSMGFGNPYGDEWSYQILEHRSGELAAIGAGILSLADTTGESSSSQIRDIFPTLKDSFPEIEWGLHLHSKPSEAKEKLEAAIQSGCERIDSALKGFGGCPMAGDSLTGNIATEALINLLTETGIDPGIDPNHFKSAEQFADRVFLID